MNNVKVTKWKKEVIKDIYHMKIRCLLIVMAFELHIITQTVISPLKHVIPKLFDLWCSVSV